MIRLLLRAYPAAWRDRYGAELEQLAADSGLSAGTAIDIVRAGLNERQRSVARSLGGTTMLLGPAYRHPDRLALLSLIVVTPTLLFVVGSLLAFQLGIQALVGPMESAAALLNGVNFLDLLLVIAPALALALAILPLVRLDVRMSEAGREVVVGLRLRAANVLVGLTALAIGLILVWYFLTEAAIEAGV